MENRFERFVLWVMVGFVVSALTLMSFTLAKNTEGVLVLLCFKVLAVVAGCFGNSSLRQGSGNSVRSRDVRQ